jgi:hypothetical protein
MFKCSVPTTQETDCVSLKKPNRAIMFREVIALYSEYHTKDKNTPCGQNAKISLCQTVVRIVTTAV